MVQRKKKKEEKKKEEVRVLIDEVETETASGLIFSFSIVRKHGKRHKSMGFGFFFLRKILFCLSLSVVLIYLAWIYIEK